MQGETAAVERVFREEYGRLIASLVRRFGDPSPPRHVQVADATGFGSRQADPPPAGKCASG